jgi:hypothetical protein
MAQLEIILKASCKRESQTLLVRLSLASPVCSSLFLPALKGRSRLLLPSYPTRPLLRPPLSFFSEIAPFCGVTTINDDLIIVLLRALPLCCWYSPLSHRETKKNVTKNLFILDWWAWIAKLNFCDVFYSLQAICLYVCSATASHWFPLGKLQRVSTQF